MMTVTYPVGDGLYINLTNKCTNSCEFCIRRNGEGAYGSEPLWLDREPTVEEVLSAVAAADPSRYREIVFCGYGEPTCRLPELLALSRELRSRYPEIPQRLNTNGHASLIAGREVAPEFAETFDTVSVSLNESEEADYATLCHPRFGEGTLAAVIDFAVSLKPYVPKVVFSVVREFVREGHLDACREIAERTGITLRVRDYIS